MTKMGVLLLTFCFTSFLINGLTAELHIPGEKIDKQTLESLGIKTIGWQDQEEDESTSQVHVHHNYSRVTVQKQQDDYYQLPTFGGQQQIDLNFNQPQLENTGQTTVDEYDYLDLNAQYEQNQENKLKHSNLDQNQQQISFDGQQEHSEYNNEQIHNAHSYGQMFNLDQIIEAESDLQSQQIFKDFPDYDSNKLQVIDQTAEATNVEPQKFYTIKEPMYIHGFKYPPDPKDVYPINQQKPTGPPETYSKCPKMATGQFVYTLSCNQFLNCWKGRGFVQNCAPGTLFNPKTLECDFASKVQCITGPRKPEETQYQPSQKIEISCPPGFSGVIPHFNNCSKFINCANGMQHIMDCPPGTLFSLKINNCDFPYKAECASWSIYFGNVNYDEHSSQTNIGKTNQFATSGSHQGQLNLNKNEQNSQYQGGYDSRYDQKYVSTDDFRSHQGSGSYANYDQSQVKRVDGYETDRSWQQNIYNSNRSSLSSQFHQHGINQINQDYLHSQHQQQYGSSSGANLHGSYSQHQGLQISKDINKQYGHYEQNQQFSQGQNQGYLTNQGQQLHGNLDQHSFEQQQNRNGASYDVHGKYNSIQCPPGATGQFSHPSDCSKFLECANGNMFIKDCGPGTVFNPESKICDFPYKVKCQTAENNQQSVGTHGHYTWQTGQNLQNANVGTPYTSQTSGTYQQSFNQETSSLNQGSFHPGGVLDRTKNTEAKVVVECPDQASGLYPHPTICSKFLNCANGQTFIQDCGPGTVFNPTMKVCDYPYNVDCDSNYGEGIIDARSTPRKSHSQDNYQNTYHDQNQNNGSRIQGSYYGHGQTSGPQGSHSQTAHSQDGNGHNVGGYYGQNTNIIDKSSDGGKAEGGFHGQSQISGTQHGFYDQSGQGGGYYDQNTHPIYKPNIDGKLQEGFNGQGQTSSSHGSVTSNQQEFYGQTGQTGGSHGIITSNQQGYYDQTGQSGGYHNQNTNVIHKPLGGGQLQGSGSQQGSYSQTENNSGSYYGHGQSTNLGQNKQNVQNQTTIWQSQGSYNQGWNAQNQGVTSHSGRVDSNPVKNSNVYNPNKIIGFNDHKAREGKNSDHITSSFPTTDLNADYEFGNEGVSLEPEPVQHKPQAKPSVQGTRKRKDFCETLDFHCSFDDCIPRSMVCDGVKDCSSGVDEEKCERYLNEFTLTSDSILAVREKERYMNISLVYCAKSCLDSKGFNCKSFSYRKDDGACFLSDTNVGLSGSLITSYAYSYYEVKAFSVNCTNLYKCPNNKCISYKKVCDGVNDCGDRTDERSCSAQAFGYEIKLNGSNKKHEGRIEIKAFGKLGYVCDDKFGLRNADVVCREVGFPLGAVEVKSNSYYAKDMNDKDVLYLMDDVSCIGNETTLRDCDFNGWGVSNCEAQEVVGVVCKTPLETCPKDHWKCETSNECIPIGFLCDDVFDCTDQSDEKEKLCDEPIQIRLAGGKLRSEGRIEILYHGVWGTVCDDDFNDDSAKVICKQLGYPGKSVAKKDGYFGAGTGPIWLDQVFCQGNETGIQNCVHWNWGEHNCEHSEDVGVVCSSTLELLEDVGSERNVKMDPRYNDILPEHLFPERCGLRRDDQFLENDDVHFRVIKGSSAKRGDYPWQASLRIKSTSKPSHWCGAVVITQNFVLTAAHCLEGFSKGSYIVATGDYNIDDVEGSEQEAYIEEFYIHEDFRKGQKMNNDIALVKLKGKGFTFTKDVQPICLPEKDLEYQKGLNCTISGFGSIASGKSGYSHQLRAGWIPLQSKEVCQMPHVYGSAITDGMICAGSLDEGIDACDGDSGGPLACLHNGYFTLYGLTSWGQHCGHANKPGVYVKVSYYRNWIDEIIRKHS